ncbi:restriction endonuclease subunit S [uncultured Clostridium sp.]|uniref:restriction endonuclease subunit S n=1 Tax=uncultured Clostridium sp. TaxID=59620 RepID=UPI0025FBED93|nr:restriction endonuclease subunit S [uncultured Clostridium sp.]
MNFRNSEIDIYSDWSLIELGKVADVLDPHPSHRAPKATKGGFPFAGIGDIDEYGNIDVNKARIVSEKIIEDHINSYKIDENSIGYGRVGTVGKVVKLKDRRRYKYALAPTLAVINPNQNIEPKFLYALLRSNVFFNQVSKYMTGSTRPSIGIQVLRKINIPYPSLIEQKKIANIITALDEKIQLNVEMHNTLQEISQVLFKRWFVDFEFPNEDGEPYKSNGGEMIESELGSIPKGWNVVTLGKVMNIITKSEKPFENPEIIYEHFSIPAYDNSLLPVYESGSLISSNKYIIDNDCILISKLNPSTKRLWNPFCATGNSICSTEFIVFKPIEKCFKSFYYELINTNQFYDYMVSHTTGSTGSRQRVKQKETLDFKFVMPLNTIIEKSCRVIRPLHEKSQRLLQENKELISLRDSLLPKLMSGEIRVEDIEANL